MFDSLDLLFFGNPSADILFPWIWAMQAASKQVSFDVRLSGQAEIA
jgi:hypothetical protein